MTAELALSNKRLGIGKGSGKGHHPNSLLNLDKGRAKLAENRRNGFNANREGYSVTARLKKLLQENSDFIPPNANPNDLIYRDQIARTMVKESACGNSAILKELLDRTEGKVPDRTIPTGTPITNNFLFVLPNGTKLTPRALIEEANR